MPSILLNKIHNTLRLIKLNLNLLFLILPGLYFSNNYGEYYKNKKLLFCFYIFIKNTIILYVLKSKKINFIYDLNNLPFGNADILNVFSTARLIKLNFKKKINFYFFFNNNKKKILKFKDKLIAKKNKNPNYFKKNKKKELLEIIRYLNKIDVNINISIVKNKKLLPKNFLFKELLSRNLKIHRYAHNINNYFYWIMNNYNKNKFYVSEKNFGKIKIKKKLPKNFITLGVRSSNNDPTRNNTIDEIIFIINAIKKKYKRTKIILLSDKKHLKIIKKKLKKQVLYSNNFVEPTYFNNGYLILKSKKYFQYKGMGLSWFAENSKIKYSIFHQKMTHEKYDQEILTKRNNSFYRNFWQINYQKFEYINDIYDIKF